MVSVQYTSMNSLGYAEISEANLSAATSIMSTLQQLAQSFGWLLVLFSSDYFLWFFQRILVLTPLIFHHTFFAIGLITMLSSLIFMRLKAEDGREMIY